jgi:two-component system alkaline phosphatase synthesis response regulator PhoP
VYRIVVLGDGSELRTLVAALEQNDFQVTPLASAGDWFERIVQNPPDVLVMDLSSLDVDHLRRLLGEAAVSEHSAVVLLVPQDLLRRLDGIPPPDDFVVLPLRNEEALARVRMTLRRRTNVDAFNTLRCGDLVIDLSNYKVTVSGQAVELTYKEYELLRFLMSNPAKVFTREQLLNRVWGYDYYGGARTVDVHIRRLRSKIELRPGQLFIETVRNVGYRFKEY